MYHLSILCYPDFDLRLKVATITGTDNLARYRCSRHRKSTHPLKHTFNRKQKFKKRPGVAVVVEEGGEIIVVYFDVKKEKELADVVVWLQARRVRG